jgi:hypothetical protein
MCERLSLAAEMSKRVQQCKRFMENFKKHHSIDMLERPVFVVVVPALAHTYLRSPEAVRAFLVKERYLQAASTATTTPKVLRPTQTHSQSGGLGMASKQVCIGSHGKGK